MSLRSFVFLAVVMVMLVSILPMGALAYTGVTIPQLAGKTLLEQLKDNAAGGLSSLGDNITHEEIMGNLSLDITKWEGPVETIGGIAGAVGGTVFSSDTSEQIGSKITEALRNEGFSVSDDDLRAALGEITLTYQDREIEDPVYITDLGDYYAEVTLPVPDLLNKPDGADYKYFMLVFYIDEEGSLSVETVWCEDNGDTTLTVRLSRFSLYAIGWATVASSETSTVLSSNIGSGFDTLNSTVSFTPESSAYGGYGDFYIFSGALLSQFISSQSLYANGARLTVGEDYELIDKGGYAYFMIYEKFMQSLSGTVIFNATFTTGASASAAVDIYNIYVPDEIPLAAPKTGDSASAAGVLLVFAAFCVMALARRVGKE